MARSALIRRPTLWMIEIHDQSIAQFSEEE
jgi:hypothetical protein